MRILYLTSFRCVMPICVLLLKSWHVVVSSVLPLPKIDILQNMPQHKAIPHTFLSQNETPFISKSAGYTENIFKLSNKMMQQLKGIIQMDLT